MGARGKLCSAAMKTKFDMIQIQAVEYDDIKDTVQRDIFRTSQSIFLYWRNDKR
jgi:hypothetical protein